MTINGSTNASGWTFKLEAYEIGSYSITNNTSTVRVDMYLGRESSQSYLGGDWSGSITVDGQIQYLSGNIPYPTYINGGSWLPLGTRDYTITHNTDGTKVAGISASFSSSDFSPSSAWASGNLTLTTIPRASSITATNADIESATTIIINRASSSFTHTITYSFGELSGTIATKTTETTIGFTVPSTFYAEIPNAKYGTCTLTCQTYSGNTLIGTKTTTFTATANENICKPEITASVVDTNNDTIALTNDNTKLVKYHSTASITWSATAKNSATISSTSINNETVETSPTVIQEITTNSINVSTTDSRGYITDLTLTPTMIDYIPLSASVSFYRTAPTTGQVSLEFSGNYFNDSFGNTNNNLTLKWYYKEKNAQNWTTGGTLVLNTDYVISENTFHSGTGTYTDDIILGSNFNYQKAYDFKFEFIDRLETKAIEQTVSKGIPIVNWDDEHFNVNGNITQNEQPLNIPNVIDSLDGNSTTDAPSVRAVNTLNNYSNTEQKIGTWFNKPLYRKCFSKTGTLSTITTGITNVNEVVKLEVMVKDSATNYWRTIPWIYNATNYDSSYAGGAYFTPTNNIGFQAGSGLTNTSKYIAIIEYTKTTD